MTHSNQIQTICNLELENNVLLKNLTGKYSDLATKLIIDLNNDIYLNSSKNINHINTTTEYIPNRNELLAYSISDKTKTSWKLFDCDDYVNKKLEKLQLENIILKEVTLIMNKDNDPSCLIILLIILFIVIALFR